MTPSDFRKLVEEHQQAVYALCAALVGWGGSPGSARRGVADPLMDAEDLAQETFVRVYQAIDRFDPAGPASLKTWILTIARRLCNDRRKKRHVEPAAIPVSAPANPEDELAARRRSLRLYAELMKLPAEQRAALALFEWAGLDYDQIAAVERVPVGTVRSRLARAREALREALGEGEERHHA